ncbi:MAG: hypothetical protein VX223_17805, partial [Myxococcota bacterium]|nr:hypothetical protein [Myxococcota bacterium]
LMLGYGIKRQWVFPTPAASVMKSELIVPPEEWMILLPGVGCIPLRWAARLRTLVLNHESGTYVISYCSLAKSLRVFIDAPVELAAVLPHATGFYVGADGTWWDGNTGIKVNGSGSNLESAEFQLVKSQECAHAVVLTPNGQSILPKPLARIPRIPGARGVKNGMDWGRVDGGDWVEFTDQGPMTSWVVSRWAASSIGLRIRVDA